MATPIALDDILQITAWCQQGSQASLNVGKFIIDGVNGAPTLEALANDFATAVAPIYAPWLTDSATFEGVIVKRIGGGAVTGSIFSTVAPTTGTAGANPLPGQVSAICTLLTGRPGRGQRGRKYFGFGDEVNTDTAFNVNAPGLAILAPMVDVWATTVNYGGADSVELKPVLAPRLAPLLNYPVTGAKLRSKLATQKRRGAYGKANASPF